MLLCALPSCFLARPKGLCRQTFPLVCSSDFWLVERWEGRGSNSSDLLASQNPDNPDCWGGEHAVCKLACPAGRKQSPEVLKEATARWVSSWTFHLVASIESPLKTAAVCPSWGDVRTNGGEHAFTSCGRSSSVQNQKELYFFFLSQV